MRHWLRIQYNIQRKHRQSFVDVWVKVKKSAMIEPTSERFDNFVIAIVLLNSKTFDYQYNSISFCLMIND